MVVPRRRLHAIPAEQELHRGGGGHASAELHGRGRRRAFARREIDPGGIHQVAPVQTLGNQAHQESEELLGLGTALEAKILFEAHALWREYQIAHPQPDRRRSDGGNPEFATAGKNPPANVYLEEVEPIDEQVDIRQKLIHRLHRHAAVEAANA